MALWHKNNVARNDKLTFEDVLAPVFVYLCTMFQWNVPVFSIPEKCHNYQLAELKNIHTKYTLCSLY